MKNIYIIIATVALLAPFALAQGDLPECPFPSEEIVFFPVTTNCSQYWECFRGNRFLMSCPGDLHWNVKENSCDYPEKANCSVVPPVTTTSDPNVTTTSPAPSVTTTNEPIVTSTVPSVTTSNPNTSTLSPDICEDELDGTYLPHPTDCKKFYECVEGKAIEGTCPVGSVWNEEVLNCDHPDNVNCPDEL